MKTRSSPALFLFLFAWIYAAQRAPAAPGDQLPGGASILDYRMGPHGQVLHSAMKASVWDHRSDRDILGTHFEMTLYRDFPVVQLFAAAPACHIDRVSNQAWDEGHIVLYTPTTNVFAQGDGFLFVQSSQLLTLSNHVETRVLKSLLKTPLLGGSSNATAAAPQTMTIFSDAGRFDYLSNRVDYAGRVHVIDPQMDVTSELLTVLFNTNGGLQSALARREVVITTPTQGRATGARGFYYLTNAGEMMELTGDASWQNGDEEAQADYFLYDSTLHFLTGSNHVRVRWPNAAPGAEHPPAGAAPRAGTNGFRRLSADFATLQMPPTNGPVERMTATGNVAITNEADHSRSLSEQAVYSRTNDSFELTGNPAWWNDKMEVKGRLLRAELTNQTYHARGDAQFRLNLAADTHAAPSSSRTTNKWLVITCDDLDYQTNLATFHNHVVGRIFENDGLRDTLFCDLLVVTLESNQVEQAVASGHVRGHSEPDPAGAVKTISCATLTARCLPGTNLLKEIVAESEVVLADFSGGSNAATNRLTAAVVTAEFSAATNRMEKTVAERDVMIDQRKGAQTLHATGERAVYTAGDGQATLTGAPFARTQRYIITEADSLIWEPKTNRFQARGHYTIIPVKSGTNSPPS